MIRALLAIAVGALLLAALPVLNGRPLYYFDTRAYFATGEQIAEKLHLSTPGGGLADLAGSAAAPSENGFERGLTTAAARSPYYSFYLFMIEKIGGLWLVVAVEAAVASWLLFVFAMAAAPRAGMLFYIAVVVVSASLTTLPLFVGFLMPDFFTGTGVLAAACVLFYGNRIGPASRTALLALVGISSLMHSTHVVAIATVAVAGWLIIRMFRTMPARTANKQAAIVLAVSLVGIGGSIAYAASVRAIYHQEIRRPPYLMARVLEDGPGRKYLESACAASENAYELCRYRGHVLDDAQAVLWNLEPEQGVFGPADNATRIQLISEEPRFVLGALRFDPVGQIVASTQNFISQLVNLDVDDLLLDHTGMLADPRFAVFLRILPDAGACAADLAACGAQKLPVRPLSVATALTVVLSLVLVIVLTWRRLVRRRTPSNQDEARATGFAATICAVIIVNAAMCGILSEPASRYQTRLTWLLPLAAMTILASRMRGETARPVVDRRIGRS